MQPMPCDEQVRLVGGSRRGSQPASGSATRPPVMRPCGRVGMARAHPRVCGCVRVVACVCVRVFVCVAGVGCGGAGGMAAGQPRPQVDTLVCSQVKCLTCVWKLPQVRNCGSCRAGTRASLGAWQRRAALGPYSHPASPFCRIARPAHTSCHPPTRRPRLLYTIPIHNNPRGVSLSEPRRRRLLALAEEFDFLVLADEVYQVCGCNNHLAAAAAFSAAATLEGRLLTQPRLGRLAARGRGGH
jgi:hypothetical protein